MPLEPLPLLPDLPLLEDFPLFPGLRVLDCLDDLLPKAGPHGAGCPVMIEVRIVGDGVGSPEPGGRMGDLDGVSVGSFVRGLMVGDPSGRAGQNAGQALAVSS